MKNSDTKFRKHLRDTKQTLSSFALRVGVSQSFLSEIAAFQKIPSLTLARDISVATGGIIPLTYWLDEAPASQVEGQDTSHTAIDNTTAIEGVAHG